MIMKAYKGDVQSLYLVINGFDRLIENRPEDSPDVRILRKIQELIIVWALEE